VTIPEHKTSPQDFRSIKEAGFSQGFPPFVGTGFEHDLERNDFPPPHVTEHWCHGDQSDQSPSTINITKIFKKSIKLHEFPEFLKNLSHRK
jgi:hypothetical protein